MKKLLLVLVLGLFLLSGCGVVDPDITPPVITLLGENPLNLNVNDQYVEPGAIALDDKDGNITHKIIIGGDVVDTNTPGTYIVTYFVKDRAGNMAQVTRTVNVKVSEQMLKLLKEYTGKEKVTRWPDGVVLVNDCTRETKSIWAQINDVIDGPVVFQATYIIDDYDYELQIAIEYIKLNPSLRPFSAGWISIDGHEYKVGVIVIHPEDGSYSNFIAAILEILGIAKEKAAIGLTQETKDVLHLLYRLEPGTSL
jgi:hypothetical protein